METVISVVTVNDSHVSVDDGPSITTITLDRPEKLNAITPEMAERLATELDQLADRPPRPVLLTGHGDVTCAGVDVEIVSDDEYDEKYPEFDETIKAVSEQFGRLSGPTAIAGKGAVIGAAFGLAVESDFVVVGADTQLAYPELTYGLVPPARRIETLSAIVGPTVAKEIVMTGEPITPERAFDLGFVNEIVPESEVESAARSLLETVAENNLELVAGIKRDFGTENP